jgi:non-specific serine/threonine protein kinase/serine/threonine-protein kinase
MTPDRAERARAIFLEALDLAPDRRRKLLDERCGDDAHLRDEVLTLLAYDAATGQFLDEPAVTPDLAPTRSRSRPANHTGRRIGGFEIRRVIGSGGMGTVYEATQDHPNRLVALKVLSRGVVSGSALRRFKREAEILGRLRHPNIAHVYDAGMFDEGEGAQPYFAMELIRGRGLLEFAEASQLGTRQRLEFFAKVCDAVQHAHLKGVIHRDLKPDNILVDEHGEPKILDFGVARATDSDIQITTVQTDIGQLIGTVPYMSPEQVTGNPSELDSRSDVYSLGVVLYELLCGRLPHNVKNTTIPEAVRVIREEDPTPLSSVSKVFRGDVETIVAKALEKERPRRYQTTAELAVDIRRYLVDEPIVARPASAFYQLRKFTRRKRALVAAALAVAVTLAVGGIVATYLAASRATARHEADRLQAVEDSRRLRQALTNFSEGTWTIELETVIEEFLTTEVVQNRYAPGAPSDLNAMLAVLDAAGQDLPQYFADRPLGEASIHYELGRTYKNLGIYDRALVRLKRAHELQVDRRPLEHLQSIKTRTQLGSLLVHLDRAEEALRLQEPLIEWARQNSIESNRYPQIVMKQLADALASLGRYDQAKDFLEEAFERERRTVGGEGPVSLRILAQVHAAQRDYERAVQLQEEAVQRHREIKRDLRGLAHALSELGELYRLQDRYEEAEARLLEGLDMLQRYRGPQHPYTQDTLRELVELYDEWGKPEKAAEYRALLREANAISPSD